MRTHPHTHLDIPEAFFKERQHLGELVVGVHIVGGAAALLQLIDDVLVLDLLVDLELLEGGAERLEERPEIIVVGEVCLRQLWAKREQKDLALDCRYSMAQSVRRLALFWRNNTLHTVGLQKIPHKSRATALLKCIVCYSLHNSTSAQVYMNIL